MPSTFRIPKVDLTGPYGAITLAQAPVGSRA